MKKIFFLLLIIFLFNSCGYKPQFGEKQKINFFIESVEFKSTDRELAQLIKSNLNRYMENKDGNNFIIETTIDYQKRPISKNTKGQIEEYELLTFIKFTTMINDKIEVLEINEKNNMINFDNEFEEIRFERNVKKSMSNSITSKLILWLINLNDN
jgi:outer membrane lipopolysaccharide assembly protein LptE/RlpB